VYNHKTRQRKQQSSAFEKSQTTIAIVQRYTSSTMRMVKWKIATKGIMTEDDPKFKSGLVLHPVELTVNRCNGGFL
jgi:hypothetical protein